MSKNQKAIATLAAAVVIQVAERTEFRAVAIRFGFAPRMNHTLQADVRDGE